MDLPPPRIIVVMGVSGSGKTEVGLALAAALDAGFYDADGFHPPENVAKMSAGTPLTDVDRQPWFDRLDRDVIRPCPPGETRVLACSALKRAYRDRLRAARPGSVRFLHLVGDFDTIHDRMTARQGHFMRAEMLRSQFATLEDPALTGEPDVLAVSIAPPVPEIVRHVLVTLACPVRPA
ncbi:MAG: gluconokinase [Verrucomicrobiales bacterium]